MSTFNGGNGNDTYTGGSSNDSISGGNGNDTISGGAGNDVIDGGNGDDGISGGEGNDTIQGGNGADIIDAGSGNDTIDAGSDNDRVIAGEGNDTVQAGNGDDTVDGGSGNDTIDGGNGNDTLTGGAGDDVINAGNGDDILDGGAGRDVINAANGNDVVIHRASENVGVLSTYDGGNGTDTLRLYVSSDISTSSTFLADVARFNAAASRGSSGTFNSLNIQYSGFERLEVILEGNTNQAPTDIALAGNTVAENAVGATVGTLSTVDPDSGNTHTYTVDDARFVVVGNTLKLADGVSLNHEDGTTISVDVTSTDAGGLSFTETFTINVTNVNEAPTDIALAGNTVTENAAGATVGTLSTVDPDSGDSHTYEVSDGRFEVSGNTLKLKDGVALDFETDGPITVSVTSTDAGGLTFSEDFNVVVTDANDAPTDISLSAASVNENAPGAVIGDLAGTDVDAGETLTFSIADAGSPFEVVGTTLKLKDGVSLDFEQDSEVLVTVRVTDSAGAIFDRGFTVTVNDGFESLAIDGYISGATVFADANGNGTQDAGEVSAITDAFGNFTLFGGSGPLVMSGGIDISTGHEFGGIMRAPAGSTVVTPLTTLVVAIAEANGVDIEAATPEEIATASQSVLVGLGLPAGLDLATFDPIAAAVSSDPAVAQQGGAAIAAAVQIQNTIVQAASLLEGAGASFADAAASVVSQLAVAINTQAGNSETIDLNSGAAVQAIIVSAASNTANVNTETVSNTAAGAATVISSGNAVIVEAATTGGQTGAELLTTLAQVSIVAQGEAASQLTQAGNGTADIATVQGNFTGESLDAAVTAAASQVGDVVGVNGDDTVDGTEDIDTLEGFGGNDTLNGLGGHDVLDGGDGNDFLNGGDGRDRATYQSATGGISVDLAAGTVSGPGVGSDTLQSIEIIRGSEFIDTFVATGFGPNSANAGSDGFFNSFEGRGGNDIITGSGNTTLSYRSATAAIVADLQLGTVTGDASVGTDAIISGVSGVNASAFDDQLLGTNSTARVETFIGNGGNDFINGRGGLDRANYSTITEDTVTGGVAINMAAGTVTGDASVGTDTLRSVEFIRGSNFADSYNATGFGVAGAQNVGSNNTLNEFEGMGGNDTITGNGNTRIAFYNATAAVTVDLAAGTATGNASVGTDTITGGVGSVAGSDFGDTFLGSNNPANTSEQFDGRGGDDFFNGRGGFDQAVYGNDNLVAAGITVDMAAGTVTGDAAVGTDTLRSIESVRATAFDDVYVATGYGVAGALNVGNNGTLNEFEGLGGNDTITGSGDTRLSFGSASAGVTVDLEDGTATGDASVGADTFTGVARVRGSSFGDTILGDDLNNNLEGQGGADVLHGRGGADLLTGGAGADTFFYASGDGKDNIIDFNRGQGDKIDLSGVAGMFSFDDVLAVAVSGNPGGTSTILNFDDFTNTLFLSNIAFGTLQEGDFIYASENPAPTEIQLSGTTVAENSANGTVVGTLTATDPGDTFTFTLIDDAGGLFALDGDNIVVLGALDFETADSHSVTVLVTDSEGQTYEESFTIDVTDVNEAPSAALASTVTAIDENTPVGAGIRVADIVVTDDALGTESITLSGADAASFAIVGNELHYVGEDPDFETKSSYAVTVDVNDESLGAPGSVESSQSFTLTINDVNEAPSVAFANTTTAIDENVAVGAGIKVADIVVTDDALGTETLTLSGADAASFAIVGGELHYVGSSPDFETKSSYSVTVDVNDESLGAPGSIEASQTFVLSINDLAGVTLTGDGGNNTLTGGLEADTLQGLAGNDRLNGGGGADVLDGGDGTADFAVYSNSSIGLTVDLQTPSNNTGEAAGDTYIGIESITGSAFDDHLFGDGVTNNLEGGLGADVLDGRGGGDFASYQNATTAIVASLMDNSVNTEEAYGDSYISIENLRGGAFDDYLVGNSGNNFLRGGLGADVLDGAAGGDTADYFNATTALVVDLGNAADNTGEAAGDSYINMEHIRAGNGTFNDTLRGNSGNNTLEGLAGNDTLEGGDGNDTLIGGLGGDVLTGGNGNDNASYEDATAGLTVDLLTTANNTGEAVGDSYSSIERVIGSAFNDSLRGDNNNNFLEGGAGADALNGRNGSDYASYQNAGSAVVVSLATPGISNTGDAVGDTYTSIENLAGSNFNDTLIGDGTNNALRGNAGGDTMDGGAGTDVAEYSNSTVGVTADLGDSSNNTGDAAGDIYISIENLRGSNNAGDVLRGNNSTNFLEGGTGNFADVLDGGGGTDYANYQQSSVGLTVSLDNPNDNTGDAAGDTYFNIEGLQGSNLNDILIGDGQMNFLRGGAGADQLDGGLGDDWAEYLNSPAGVGVVADLSNAANNTNDAAGDTYTSIENLLGTNSNDTLTGDSNDNVLRGKTGADVLNGGDGIDTADYTTAPGGVVADLATPGNNTGDALGDTYDSIENLRGTSLGDTLRGDGNDNRLEGQGSSDTLDGRDGADVLVGGSGSDLLIGGTGDDTFVFAAFDSDGDTIDDFAGNGAAAGDTIEFQGFGTEGDGATFTFLGGSQWQIHSGLDGHDEVITLSGSNVGSVDLSDYLFVA